MGAWEPVAAGVTSADGHLDCPSARTCKGKWFGHDKFRLNTGMTVTFQVTTFSNPQDSAEHFHQEAARTAEYQPLTMPRTGDESLAYLRNAGGLDGGYLTMRVGTVVATVSVEEGPPDVALPQMSEMFEKRLGQALSGRTPDAALPPF
ncbi:hypothetical protein SAMN06265355_10457 [Actinomadura mexicana]|uniref:Uncharacterized protein n=2 Tax=Actinomadura mexicana TaxID=134959 RepID=A0A238X8N3_9ACTN|nr:hypothetical protein SAMN06265355_10457 [Actinomadura mexicana]